MEIVQMEKLKLSTSTLEKTLMYSIKSNSA